MKTVISILEQIEQTSSRNEKKRILAQNKDNELLKKFFLYAYNRRWIFGIGQKSIRKYTPKAVASAAPPENHPVVAQKELFRGVTTERISCGYSNIFDLLDELIKHPYGSNNDIAAVNELLSRCDDQRTYQWYVRLILKDLKIGCTIKTVNEVYDDYIPYFEVMLAHPYEDHQKKINGHEFQLQEKINGFRFITYLYPNGTTEFFTRNGVQLFNFPEIEAAFSHDVLRPREVMVYDGEAQSGMSFNETQKYMMRGGPKTGIIYNVFECQPLDEWDRGESIDELFYRYDYCKTTIPNDHPFIKLVPELYRGNELSMVTTWFNYAKSQGWEGIMVKLNLPYIRQRTWRMLKVKEMQEIDLVCIRVNKGEPLGRFEHTLGSITVDYNGVEVNVGGGFSDKDRNFYWENPDEVVGKTVTVQYFMETTNERGLPSLQFPQFIGVRQDK